MTTPAARPRSDVALRLLVSGASVVILIGGLHAAADVLNPILLALLLALSLSPLVTFLTARGMKKSVAITLVVVALLVFAVVTGAIVARSASELLRELPHYENHTRESLASWKAAFEAHGIHVDDVLPSGEQGAKRFMDVAREVVGAIFGMVSASLVVVLLTVLFVIEIAHKNDTVRGVGALTNFVNRVRETATPIRRYMGITALTGAANALANLVLLAVIGVPHPGLFAIVAFFFHFVPAIGNLLSLAPAAALTLVVLGSKPAIGVIVGYIVTNVLSEHVLKPLVLSKDLDVSIVEIFLSLLAWGYVFGPAGALLAVPATLTLRHVLSAPGAIEAVTGEAPPAR